MTMTRGSGVSLRWDSPQPPKATCAGAQHPHSKTTSIVSCCSETLLCFSLCPHCLLSCHWEPCEESGSVISTASLQVFTDTDKILLNSSRLNSPSSACAHKERCSSPSMAFLALHWALSCTSTLDTCSRHSFVSTHPAGTTPPPTAFSGARTAPGKLHKLLNYSCESRSIKMGISLKTLTQHSWRD